MISVTSLFIYPVKSLGGFAVDEVEIVERGFKHDRRWMLVDKENRFLTQRELPLMALFKSSIINDHLNIHYLNEKGGALQVSLAPPVTKMETVQLWSHHCKAQAVSDRVDQWFSDLLHISCRLVYMPDNSRRRVDTRYANNNEITAFTDDFPILMIGESSLADLNSRLEYSVPMNRFRPNIVFTGGEPFEEDHFESFSIGNVQMQGAKRCSRCMITTIDQKTAIAGKEPLKTLAGFRQKNNNIYMGEYLLHQNEGIIKFGDEIIVSVRKL